MDFADFILQHEGDDLPRLALSRSRYGAGVPDWDLALTTLEVRGKLRSKVPQWYAVPSLHYPLKLSAEQCSSAETARYKASVALSAVREDEWEGPAPEAWEGWSEAKVFTGTPFPDTGQMNGKKGGRTVKKICFEGVKHESECRGSF